MCLILKVRGESELVSTLVWITACLVVCVHLSGSERSHALLVHGVVLEALTEPGLEDRQFDDSDSLTVADLPCHRHTSCTPVLDSAA